MSENINDLEEKFILAKDFYNKGFYNQAKELFIELTTKDPLKEEFWFSLAATYQMQKEYLLASSSYLRALILKPHDAKIYFHIAECMLSLDEKQNALSMLEMAYSYCNDLAFKEKIALLINQNK